jgi:UDP-N-acetylmuramoylalanine--D-glutamate ligase
MSANPADLLSWTSDWSGVRVTVVGLGEVGFSLVDTLAELGAQVSTVYSGPVGDRATIAGVLGVALHEEATDEEITSRVVSIPADLIVLAPEWEPELEVELPLWNAGVPVWSDVEFSVRVADKPGSPPPMVFLAGNYASHIADAAQRIFLHAKIRAARAGVDAPPVLDALRHPDGTDAVLWTLSARQLWRMGRELETARRPRLTVSIDDGGELASESLEALYTQTVEACVYRRAGDLTERAVEKAFVVEGCRAIGVAVDTPGMSDLGRVEDIICDRAFLPDRKDRALELCTVDELEKAGFKTPQQVEVALAAFAVLRALDVAPEVIGGALQVPGWPSE